MSVQEESKSGIETPIVLHHLNNSRSQRILWLLEELQVPYTIKFYQRNKDSTAPPELFDVHPLGKTHRLTHPQFTSTEQTNLFTTLYMHTDMTILSTYSTVLHSVPLCCRVLLMC